jgi:hypothetical protein
MFWPESIYGCHLKPNPSRAPVPLMALGWGKGYDGSQLNSCLDQEDVRSVLEADALGGGRGHQAPHGQQLPRQPWP